MAAILDAIFNFTPSARDPDCPPKFFYLPRGVLPGLRVKMRGYLIAHGTHLSPRTMANELMLSPYTQAGALQFSKKLAYCYYFLFFYLKIHPR